MYDRSKSVYVALGLSDEDWKTDSDYATGIISKILIQPDYHKSDAIKEIASLDISDIRKVQLGMAVQFTVDKTEDLFSRMTKEFHQS